MGQDRQATIDAQKRERLIHSWAKEIKTQLDHLLPNKPGEADLRHCVEPLLDNFCREVGVPPLKHAEYSLFSGIADAVFDRFIIEYKRPSFLSPRMDLQTTAALDQLKGYLRDMAKGRDKSEHLGGVVFDGCYIIFVRYHNGRFVSETLPLLVNEHSLYQLLSWLANLASGKALTSANLSNDFAIEQPHTQQILGALVNALNSTLAQPESIVGKLFEQWKFFFSESIDYSEAFGGRKLDPLRKWVAKAGIEVKTQEETERFFFALHTYFALLVKLLAWLALSRHIGVKIGGPSFSELAGADSDLLLRKLKDMEEGGIFRAFGISNLLEGDFFSWYLHVPGWGHDSGPLERAVRDLLKLLNQYEPTTLSIRREETRDLFKKLYHYLLPREIRHALGEYYTPDWLAQRLLNQIDNEYFTADPRRKAAILRRKLKELRFLDPACGSGTFLVLIIARMMQLGDSLMMAPKELLDAILRNVVGIDLNPLAVLTARVNYVLAISDLLGSGGEITIPVYLADSVRTPAEGEGLFGKDVFEFPTAIGKFYVPSVVCKPERFDRFCSILEESVKSEVAPDSFTSRVVSALKLSKDDWSDVAESRLKELYAKLADYHKRGMNGLWARLLRNNFAPLTMGKFDYIVGNPPWVNWESLPDDYRVSLIPLYQDRYRLFPHTGFRARHGSAKMDISTLMLYVVADVLLKPAGRLGFVITQSVFKTDAGKGFRRFSISKGEGKETPVRITYVDDMVSLNPFEGAANRTATLVLQKGKSTSYPVQYTVWRKLTGSRFNYDSTVEEVQAATKRLPFVAEPVDDNDPTSAWLCARRRSLAAIRKVIGKSDYTAHEGVNSGGANAVYWVQKSGVRPNGLTIISNITEGAKVKVDQVTKPVETDLLYPLLRARDVHRWKAASSAWIIVPQDRSDFKHGYPELRFQKDYPKAYEYVRSFRDVLANRIAYQKYLAPSGEPWYSLYDIKNYTFSPWKVVWTRVGHIEAAVPAPDKGKPAIPQETLTLVECRDSHEAYYIAALVNATPFQFAASSYSQEGGKSMGSMHVMQNIRIPKFDPKNKVHQRLSELSAKAHDLVRNQEPRTENQELTEVETEVDSCAAQLWGLTAAELAEIQRSLKELTE
jgi:SAM-dependent methyltransferase